MLYKEIWVLSEKEEKVVLDWLKYARDNCDDAEAKELLEKVVSKDDEMVYEFGESFTLICALLNHLFETLNGDNNESIEWLKERMNADEAKLKALLKELCYE